MAPVIPPVVQGIFVNRLLGNITVLIISIGRTLGIIILSLIHHKVGVCLNNLVKTFKCIEFILCKLIYPCISHLKLVVYTHAVISNTSKFQIIDMVVFSIHCFGFRRRYRVIIRTLA